MNTAVTDRYSRSLATLHGLLALLILGLLYVGWVLVGPSVDTATPDVNILRLHFAGGVLAGVLTLARIFVRRSARNRAVRPLEGGPRGAIARLVQSGTYAAVIAMAASGLVMAVSSGLNLYAFGGAASWLRNIDELLAGEVHSAVATLLALLIAVHVAGGFYHQWVLKDGALRRISLRS